MTITPQQYCDEARKWLETRWVHQGRNEYGIDCAGLLIKTHQALGLPVVDEKGYRRSPSSLRFLEHIRAQTDRAEGPAPGTIGVFREANFPCHTGIFATDQEGRLTIIHAYLAAKKVVEEPFLHQWPVLLIETRLVRGVTY